MSTRTIISIDEQKCNGCGLCIPNCPEGALQVIDGKVRLVSDLFCDGLGACVGYCPEGAITLIEREAEPYDERRVMEGIARQGANTIRAHLEHLDSHGEEALLKQALAFLAETGTPVPQGFVQGRQAETPCGHHMAAGKPTTAAGHTGRVAVQEAPSSEGSSAGAAQSHLGNWPIQLHLMSPMAPQFKGKDVLLSADCVAYAVPDFHAKFLDGKMLTIACPKLDEGKDIYREKITALIDHAQISTLTVLMMEVPCCRGLLALAQQACAKAHRKVPLKAAIVSIDGGSLLSEEWV
jgi:NAD-dependent dihydropyrimidine dehydrogenase PreA subunit